jgi:hypothetical protein
MIFKYLAIKKIPKQLEYGIVYHNQEFELAAMLCACGCGHRVTLLVPDSHQVKSSRGLVTVTPSIAVCDAPCRSHYFITEGRVDMLPAFSAAQASAVMRGQIARHATNDKHRSWMRRLWDALLEAIRLLFQK